MRRLCVTCTSRLWNFDWTIGEQRRVKLPPAGLSECKAPRDSIYLDEIFISTRLSELRRLRQRFPLLQRIFVKIATTRCVCSHVTIVTMSATSSFYRPVAVRVNFSCSRWSGPNEFFTFADLLYAWEFYLSFRSRRQDEVSNKLEISEELWVHSLACKSDWSNYNSYI